VDNSGTYSDSTNAFTSSSRWVWKPPDSLNGDVARVIFYMDVRYEGENGELDLEVTDSLLPSSSQLPFAAMREHCTVGTYSILLVTMKG
jgi:endonuclease I